MLYTRDRIGRIELREGVVSIHLADPPPTVVDTGVAARPATVRIYQFTLDAAWALQDDLAAVLPEMPPPKRGGTDATP